MGGAVSAGVDNDDLVDNLKAANYITTPLLERVFRAVDRGDYFTEENYEQAYRDNAWKKGNLHLSAPCIYAKVMEGLQLAPGHSFLNLGSGTGYLSTMAGLIVGPNGVNHGVELHADVLKYSLERLENFQKNSPAIDAFNFCDPQFVQGNCLCLSADVRLYDRVYCGASCPESREQYMKSLIKPGGVLVMPINDQLVKMTRNGPDTWETVALLPVSFSSLVMPDPNHPPATVTLPCVNLFSDLQNSCRQQIRSILRANIDLERPELSTAANKPVGKHPRPSHRRNVGRFVGPYVTCTIPFYEADDDEDSHMLSDDDDDDEDDTLFEQRHTAHQINAFIELARDLAGQRRREREERRNQDGEEEGSNEDELEEENEAEDDEEEEPSAAKSKKICSSLHTEESQEATKETEQTTKKSDGDEDVKMYTRSSFLKSSVVQASASTAATSAASSSSVVVHSAPIPVVTPAPASPSKASKKREKFDSGVGDEIENGKGPSSEESDFGDERDMDVDIDDSSDSAYSDNSAPPLMNYLLDPDDPICPCGGDCGEAFKGKKTAKQKKEDKQEEEEGEEAERIDEEDGEGKEEGAACKKASATEIYSTHMREKIKLLPLPLALKLYLNYNREL